MRKKHSRETTDRASQLYCEYMGFYNQKRPHRKLDLQTSDQFERSWFEKGVTARIERENKKATFGRGQKDVSQKSLYLHQTF